MREKDSERETEKDRGETTRPQREGGKDRRTKRGRDQR